MPKFPSRLTPAFIPLLASAALVTTFSRTASARDPWLWPFATNSPWNMPIGSGAIYASATDARTQSLINNPAGYNVGTMDISLSAASDPLREIIEQNPYTGVTTDLYLQISNSISPPPYPGDAHMLIADPNKYHINEFWQFHANSASPGNWLCSTYTQNPLDRTGIGGGGAKAYGGSAFAGTIRVWEVQAGVIPHALAVAIGRSQLGPTGGYIWPATADDNATYTGHCPMGTLAAIPPSVNLSGLGLTTGGLMLATAMQNYGVYVTDSAGADLIVVEDAAVGMSQVTQMGWDLSKVWQYLRPVTNNTPTTIGGGGTPRQPLASPFTETLDEMESLAIASQTSGVTARVSQDPIFSNQAALFFDATATGQAVTVVVPAVSAGSYDLRVGVKSWYNKGEFQLSITKAGSTSSPAIFTTVDTYNPTPSYNEADLGTYTAGSTSDKWFKFTVMGKNAASGGYGLALDYITLIPK